MKTCSYLQQQHQLRVLDVHGDVKWRLVKLAERVHVSAVLDECFRDSVVSVLRRPVKSRHLQHVFGVDVSATLQKPHTRTHASGPRRRTRSFSHICEKYPNQQLHDDGVSLGSSHVQRRPVHFGTSVSAHPSSQQDVSGGVMAVLGCEVEGRGAQLQTDEQT